MRSIPLLCAILSALAFEASAQTSLADGDKLTLRLERRGDGVRLDPAQADELVAALLRPDFAERCIEISVEGSRKATREYALALTHREAEGIAATLRQKGIATERLVTIGRGRPDAEKAAPPGALPYSATLKLRPGPCN